MRLGKIKEKHIGIQYFAFLLIITFYAQDISSRIWHSEDYRAMNEMTKSIGPKNDRTLYFVRPNGIIPCDSLTVIMNYLFTDDFDSIRVEKRPEIDFCGFLSSSHTIKHYAYSFYFSRLLRHKHFSLDVYVDTTINIIALSSQGSKIKDNGPPSCYKECTVYRDTSWTTEADSCAEKIYETRYDTSYSAVCYDTVDQKEKNRYCRKEEGCDKDDCYKNEIFRRVSKTVDTSKVPVGCSKTVKYTVYHRDTLLDNSSCSTVAQCRSINGRNNKIVYLKDNNSCTQCAYGSYNSRQMPDNDFCEQYRGCFCNDIPDECKCADGDSDCDGVPDSEEPDSCIGLVEDIDSTMDSDGCPDPDNDSDGICDPWVAKQSKQNQYSGVCTGSDVCPDQECTGARCTDPTLPTYGCASDTLPVPLSEFENSVLDIVYGSASTPDANYATFLSFLIAPQGYTNEYREIKLKFNSHNDTIDNVALLRWTVEDIDNPALSPQIVPSTPILAKDTLKIIADKTGNRTRKIQYKVTVSLENPDDITGGTPWQTSEVIYQNDIDYCVQQSIDDGGIVNTYKNCAMLPEFSIFPDNNVEVSADLDSFPVAVVVDFPEYADSSNVSYTMTVDWSLINGNGNPGTLKQSRMIVNDNVAINQLILSHTAGSSCQVYAKVSSISINGTNKDTSGFSSTSSIITQIPGLAASISMSPSALSYPADESSTITINATVKDAHNNNLNGNTAVWFSDSSGIFKDAETEKTVTNGTISAVVYSGDDARTQKVFLAVDSVIDSVTLNSVALDAQISSSHTDSLVIESSGAATLTATFTDKNGKPVADGTEVSWFTTNGKLSGITTTTNGQSRAILSSSMGRIGHARVGAGVGNAVATIKVPFKSNKSVRLVIERPVISGNRTTDGTYSVDYLDVSSGTPIERSRDIDVYASTKVHVYGAPYDTVKIKFGEIQAVLAKRSASATNEHVKFTGLVEDSLAILDVTGHGEFKVQSLGAMNPLDSLAIFSYQIEATATDASTYIATGAVAEDKALAFVENFARGFVGWGKLDGVDAVAGDFAASMIIWGDVRDVCKELGVAIIPGGKDLDKMTFTFAAAGLILEFAPGIGEGADAFAAVCKILAKVLPQGPLRDFVFEVTKGVFTVWKNSGVTEAAKYIDKYIGMFKKLIFDHVNNIGKIASILTRNLCESVAKIEKLAPNLDILGKIVKISDDAGELVARKSIEALDGLDETALKVFTDNTDKLDNLAEYLKKNGVPSDEVKNLINQRDVAGVVKRNKTAFDKYFTDQEILDFIAKNDVWKMNDQFLRGDLVEEAVAVYTPPNGYKGWDRIGQQNNGFYPLVDFQKGDAYISLKSLDINRKTSPVSAYRKHIMELVNEYKPPKQIKLDIRIPDGPIRPQMQKWLERISDFGTENNIIIEIVKFP